MLKIANLKKYTVLASYIAMAQLFLIIRTQLHMASYALLFNLTENTHICMLAINHLTS